MTVVLIKRGDKVTEEKPHEDTGRKWLPHKQKREPQKEPVLPRVDLDP